MKNQKTESTSNETPPEPRQYPECDKQWWATFNATLTGAASGAASVSDVQENGWDVLEAAMCGYWAATEVHGFTPDSYKGQRGDTYMQKA